MTRALLLLMVLGWLYFRLRRRMRGATRICPRCGQSNARHLSRCWNCSALLS
jgi:hypothetical protein